MRRRVCIDPGHGGHRHVLPPTANEGSWEEKVCLHCQRPFYVRKCYAKRGQGRFCSTACGTTYRNINDNPTKKAEVRAKISANHANVSGDKNPMYGRRGERAPSWVDGRNSISGRIWRKIALMNKPAVCELCGTTETQHKIHVHHKDGDTKNNILNNLLVVCVGCHNNVAHEYQRNALGQYVSAIRKEVM